MKLISKNTGIVPVLCFLCSTFLFACSSSGSSDSPATGTAGDNDTAGDSGGTEGTSTEGTSTEGTSTEGTSTEGASTEGASTEGASTEGASTEGTDMAMTGECTASPRAGTGDAPYVGNIFRPSTPNDERFHTLWNQVTPENAGKWFSVEASRDVMDWQVLDAAVSYATEFNYTFKYHTLIAGANEPEWMSALSAEDQEQEIIEWFDEVSTRFPNLPLIEVISEPVSEQPSYKEALGGDGDTGWDWVIESFELARARFPNSELILNDYKVSATDDTNSVFLGIVALLQARNLIDAVGIEGHFLEQTDTAAIDEKLNALTALGIPVYLSDLDINEADDQVQLDKMKSIFPLFYENTAVQGLTFWGYRENQLWREDAFLLSNTETDRPALDWLECYLGLDDAG